MEAIKSEVRSNALPVSYLGFSRVLLWSPFYSLREAQPASRMVLRRRRHGHTRFGNYSFPETEHPA